MKPTAEDQPARSEARTESEAEQRDRALIAAVGRGDRAAFERLYLAHQPALVRFIARHTSRRDLIDEVINDAFWVVWRKAGEFRGESKVATWIIGIAYRCMLKALRGGTPAENGTENATATEDLLTDVGGEAEQRELRDWVRRGLALLAPEQRTTMELAYFLGQSCDEIAAIMNCATGTVKARMFHARLRLRNSLPALGGDDTSQTARK